MSPSVKRVPRQIMRGIRIKIAEINSKTPIPILPKGSNPTFVKTETLSVCIANLNRRVCTKIMVMIILNTSIILEFVLFLI